MKRADWERAAGYMMLGVLTDGSSGSRDWFSSCRRAGRARWAQRTPALPDPLGSRVPRRPK
jgi:hypothetical protein